MKQVELVLVVSDMFIPDRISDIPEQFKSLLIPNKIQYVVSLGNIGSRESYDWLRSLSNNYNGVKGDFDENTNLPETKTVQIGEFKIGMIHGHQVVPWGDPEALANVQRQLDCDILLSGHTHTSAVNIYDGKYFINPGSISGAYSPMYADPIPSFVLMVIQGDYAIVYLYELNDKTKKFDVSKMEFTKNSGELKSVAAGEEEEAEEEQEGNYNEERGAEVVVNSYHNNQEEEITEATTLDYNNEEALDQ
jgi:vacuolar protein sorting-associated protein 29